MAAERKRKVAGLSSSVPVPEQPQAESYEAAVADDLAGAVEHVLNSRYSGTRAPEEPAKPRAAIREVTSDSLLAELTAAREANPQQPQVAEPEQAPRKRSPALPLFAFIGFAMIGYGLLLKSPWHDQVPSLDRILQLLH
jgi:hypothetical protein